MMLAMRFSRLIGVCTYFWPAAALASSGWFTEVTETAGIAPPDVPRGYERMMMPDVMASGAALFDLEGDGDLDVYLVNQTWSFGTDAPPPGSGRLYRHDEGGRFTDVTAASGLVNRGYGIGLAIGDDLVRRFNALRDGDGGSGVAGEPAVQDEPGTASFCGPPNGAGRDCRAEPRSRC